MYRRPHWHRRATKGEAASKTVEVDAEVNASQFTNMFAGTEPGRTDRAGKNANALLPFVDVAAYRFRTVRCGLGRAK